MKEVVAPTLDTLQRKVAEQQGASHSHARRAQARCSGARAARASVSSVSSGASRTVDRRATRTRSATHFVGLAREIVSPDVAFREAGAYTNPVLVIASSFVKEIPPRVRALGNGRATCASVTGNFCKVMKQSADFHILAIGWVEDVGDLIARRGGIRFSYIRIRATRPMRPGHTAQRHIFHP